MKKNKTMSLDEIVINHLSRMPNASEYIDALVKEDIARTKEIKDKNMANINDIYTQTQIETEQQEKRLEDKKLKAAAWDGLEFEVREEIKSYPDWGKFWKEDIYPILTTLNHPLTVSDVRRIDREKNGGVANAE